MVPSEMESIVWARASVCDWELSYLHGIFAGAECGCLMLERLFLESDDGRQGWH